MKRSVASGVEDRGGAQLVGAARGGRLVEPGQLGREPAVGVVAEHDDGPRDRLRLRARAARGAPARCA